MSIIETANSIRWCNAPSQSLVPELRAWINHGALPEDCIRSMIENDWRYAVLHADPKTLRAMREWALFYHWELPARCWGSAELAATWAAHGGLDGLSAAGVVRPPQATLSPRAAAHRKQIAGARGWPPTGAAARLQVVARPAAAAPGEAPAVLQVQWAGAEMIEPAARALRLFGRETSGQGAEDKPGEGTASGARNEPDASALAVALLADM